MHPCFFFCGLSLGACVQTSKRTRIDHHSLIVALPFFRLARYGEAAVAALLPVVEAYFNMSYLVTSDGGHWLGEGDVASIARNLATHLTAHLDPTQFTPGYPYPYAPRAVRIQPQWGPIRFDSARLSARTPHGGCIVRVVSRDEIKKNTHQ